MTNPALKRRAKFSLPLRGSKSESNVAKNQFVQKLKLQTTSIQHPASFYSSNNERCCRNVCTRSHMM
jgi:hypothetical protein